MTDHELFDKLKRDLKEANALYPRVWATRRECRECKVLSPWTKSRAGTLVRVRPDMYAVAEIWDRGEYAECRTRRTLYRYKTVESAVKWTDRRLARLNYRLLEDSP